MSDGAFEIEARRVLRRLSQGGRLRRCADCYLMSGRRGRRLSWPLPFVEALRARDWLREDAGVLTISQAGESWLKRDAAKEEDFAAQHRVLDARLIKDERGRECYVVVNAAESPLTFLQRIGVITPQQFEAGEKLRRDFTMAQLTPRMGIDYTTPVGRGARGPNITETALAARQRFNRAMRAAGPGLSDVLFDVCCYLKGLEESERTRNWPRASAKVVLRIALDRLAGHYGMHAAKRRRVRSWSMEEDEP